MKVAVLVGRIGPGTGTAGVAHALCGWLRDRGHHVVAWAGAVDRAPEGIAVHPLGDRRTAAGRVPAGFVRLALDRVPGCEVFRAGGGVHHARIPRLSPEAALDRAAARGARIVLCNAWRTAGEVVAHHGVAPERIRVVRTGVDLARFRPDPERRRLAREAWRVPPGGRVALFLGHGWRRKGLDTAITAFARAAGERDRLVVIGHDAHPGRWTGRLRADPRAIVLGPVPDPERWLPGADALLLPTRYDPAANATLEAMACGVPPVVSLCDGSAEIVPDRRLVVGNPADASGFSRSLRYAWESSALSAACRAAAERWPGPRMAERVEQILRETWDG